MRRYLALAAMVLLSACASVTTDTEQTVLVETPEVSGASCKLTDSKSREWTVESTPGSALVRKGDGPMNVVCKKEGYEPGTTLVQESLVAMTFGNVLIGGGIGVVIDAASGAAEKYLDRIMVHMTPLAAAAAAAAQAKAERPEDAPGKEQSVAAARSQEPSSKRIFESTPPKRIKLASGETVCDISGKWDSQYYHARGLFEDIVTIEQTGKRYRMIKSVAHPWLEPGSVWFKGTLNSKGFEVVEAIFSSGWTTVPAKINEWYDTINLSTVNGSIDFFKLDETDS